MALNPIIEAFITAREQAARDFNNSENRKFASEQAQERFKQELEIQKNNLQQQKLIQDAEHKLRETELAQRKIFGERGQSADAAKLATELITKGLMKQTIPGLIGNENAPVGQIGDMEAMLQQIPGVAPQVGAIPNTAPVKGFFPGGEEEARAFVGSVTPYEQVMEQELQQKAMLQDLKDAEFMFQQRFKDQGAENRIKLQGANQLGVAKERGKTQLEVGAAHDAAMLEAARIRAAAARDSAAVRASAKAKTFDGSDVHPSTLAPFIDATRSYEDMALLPIKERSAINSAMNGSGYKFLSKLEQAGLTRVGVMNQTLKNAQRLSDLYKDGVTKNIAEIRTLSESINAVLGTVSRGVAGEKGVLTQPDINRIKAIIPSWGDHILSIAAAAATGQDYKINDAKVKELREYIKNTYGSVFNKMPEDQANILVNKYNANGLGVYSPKLRATPPE